MCTIDLTPLCLVDGHDMDHKFFGTLETFMKKLEKAAGLVREASPALHPQTHHP